MDYSNANQMILQQYELMSTCIDKNSKGIAFYKAILKELFKGEDKLSNENIEKFVHPCDSLFTIIFLLDDFQDDSKLRNEKPTAHRLYGPNAVINYCMHSQILTFKKFANLFPPCQQSQVLKMFTKGMITMGCGQGMDIYWRDTAQCPTEKQYMAMIQAKTVHCIVLLIDMISLYTGCANKYSKLCLLFGTYWQLRNDYVNLKSQKYAKSKGFCEDITEGKFSLPIIHAITNNQQDTSLLNIIKQRTENVELKKHFLNRLEKSGSLEYTWNRILEVNAQVQKEIAQLGGLPYFEKFF